ncbi:MAG: tetratricopeptide repeat protein [Anaerolineae bacterium]|nr:MAG: tetratricopeptide repeat protein [Anaerolineae bacterium]
MAKIALRAYNHEIGEMVDHGQIDEAIAHCRHILQTYPRHVDTYRLLGKAYLEGQRYGDAADILQRVLSSVPEDFISHVGMSIIREDEGNMDSAIMHMERAFEGQPSNQAIQDELRRLYGRRDGREPGRIRLTRGALARMYAHGNLHDQAVAELQAALTEDPQRPDLSILLAEMYFQLGKKADAADACTKLLAKLPNCLAANRLLTLLLDEKTHAEEKTNVRKRWFALDPYAARLPAIDGDPASVPDDAITVDNLDYDPSTMSQQPGTGKPGWASSLGVDLGEQEESAEWMAAGAAASGGSLFGSRTEEESAGIFGSDSPAESSLFGDSQDGGAWGSFGSDQPAADWMAPAPATAADDDTPDWLSAAAPTAASEETSDETPDWLSAAAPTGASDESADSVPDWLSAAAPANGAGETADETPDWLSAAPAASAPEPATEETPDWLAAGVAAGAAASAAAPGDDLESMDWLDSLTDEVGSDLRAEAAAAPVAPSAAAPADDLESMDWLDSLTDEVGSDLKAEAAASAKTIPGNEENMDWLSDLAGDSAGAAAAKPEPELPDFLKEAGWEAGSGAPEQPSSILDGEDEPAAGELAPGDVPDWMQQLQPPAPTAVDNDFAAALNRAATTTGGNLGWGEASADKAPGDNTLASFLEETQPTAAAPEDDWFTNLTAEADKPQGEETMAPTSADDDQDWLKKLGGESSSSDDDLENMDWLDSLTEEVGKDLRAEAAAAAAPADDGPDWLKNLAGDEPAAPAPAPAAAAPSDDLENMDWLDSLTAEVGNDLRAEAAAAAPAADDGLDWLNNLGDAPAAPASAPAAAAPSDDLESMDWLDSLTAEVGDDLKAEAAAAAHVDDGEPDWLRNLGDEPAATTTPANTDDALAWMENLAAKQGAAEDELLTRPDNRMDEVPDWVRKAAEAPPAPPAPRREPAPAPATPPVEKYVPPSKPEPAAPVGAGTNLSEAEGMDDALAWLEGLAANQGAAEEELVTPAERRTGELPRWVVEERDAAEHAPAKAEDDMGWLDTLAAETPAASEDENAADDWLKQLEAEQPTQPAPPIADAGAPPSWLDEITEEPGAGMMDAAPSVPEWLKDVADEGRAPEPVGAQPEWLPETPEIRSEASRGEWLPETPAAAHKPMAEPAPVAAHESVAAGAPAPRPTPVRAPTAKPKSGTAGKTDDIRIAEARHFMADGDIEKSAAEYVKLVTRGRMVEDVIVDLREALRRHPVDVSLWQALGDAYTRQDLLQEAMDAYSKAEDLLRF